VAAYGGFRCAIPTGASACDFDRLSKSHVYGLSQIYEMVINNNRPTRIFLEGNSLVDSKNGDRPRPGHVDSSRNNYYFSRTNRHMIDEMANHATRVRRHIETPVWRKWRLIDSCLWPGESHRSMSPFIVRPWVRATRA